MDATEAGRQPDSFDTFDWIMDPPESGLRYESTLAYADAIDLRRGTHHEYQVYGIRRNKRLGPKERPLVALPRRAGDD